MLCRELQYSITPCSSVQCIGLTVLYVLKGTYEVQSARSLSRSHPAFPGADTLSVLMTLCCANKGERAVVLALATLFKTVATMPSTTAWVQSHEGERALQRILRHLSDTSFAPDAMALRRVLVHLLSNLAAVGGSV